MYNSSYQPTFAQQQQQQRSFSGAQVQSQYRGYQRPFQPTGQVQSFYQPQQRSTIPVNTFHTQAYRGDQPNHDASLRADSVNPSQQQAIHRQPQAFRSQSFQSAPIQHSFPQAAPMSSFMQQHPQQRSF